MSVIVIPAQTFLVSSPEHVHGKTVDAMLSELSKRGILLTSHGNVGPGVTCSLVTEADYWQCRAKETCLDVAGIKFVMERVQRMIRDNGGRWNYTWSSRAMRCVFLQAEPDADRASVGNGEFIAAMMFSGFACRFNPQEGTDCVFKAEISPRFMRML